MHDLGLTTPFHIDRSAPTPSRGIFTQMKTNPESFQLPDIMLKISTSAKHYKGTSKQNLHYFEGENNKRNEAGRFMGFL